MRRRHVLSAACATTLGAALPAYPQGRTHITYGYTAVSDYASVFVATEEGMFSKRMLDVDLKFIPLNSTLPAAIQSDSLQIGGPTPTVYLQSVDGGLDHVVLAGGGVLSKSYTDLAVLARVGTGLRSAQDFVGRKVGVPGLGALLHVAFRQWLKLGGVDYRKVNFIEAPFPQHADLMRGGALDAVVSAGPFMAAILEAGTGYVASYYTTFLPEGLPTVLHVATREWVKTNPQAARAFAEAVQEGAEFVRLPKNDAKVRAALAKYLRLSPAIAASMQISPPGAVVKDKQLATWVQIMGSQDMLKTTLNPASLLLK